MQHYGEPFRPVRPGVVGQRGPGSPGRYPSPSEMAQWNQSYGYLEDDGGDGAMTMGYGAGLQIAGAFGAAGAGGVTRFNPMRSAQSGSSVGSVSDGGIDQQSPWADVNDNMALRTASIMSLGAGLPQSGGSLGVARENDLDSLSDLDGYIMTNSEPDPGAANPPNAYIPNGRAIPLSTLSTASGGAGNVDELGPMGPRSSYAAHHASQLAPRLQYPLAPAQVARRSGALAPFNPLLQSDRPETDILF